MIAVYAMNVSEIDVSDKKLLGQMSAKRLEKINSLKPINKKRQSIGAELLLNRAVSERMGQKPPIEWETDGNGKLFVPNADFFVNLSHSGDYAVCAVCDSAVGIDIERVRTADKRIADRFFAEDERRFIESAPSRDDAFFEIWVRKESLVKASGKGIGAVPLSSFSVLGETAEYNGAKYRFKRYSVRDKSYRLCVAFAV